MSGLCLLLSYRHMLPVLQSYNYPHFCGVNQGGAQPPAREKNVIMIQAQQRAPALHMLAPSGVCCPCLLSCDSSAGLRWAATLVLA